MYDSRGTEVVVVPRKTYTPIGCLLALHVYEKGVTDTGIVLPRNAAGTPLSNEVQRAIVIATGPEVKWAKEGAIVLIAQAVNGVMVTHQGQKTFLCREDHLGGIEIPECPMED